MRGQIAFILCLGLTIPAFAGGNDLATFEAHCRSIGGTIRENSAGQLQCYTSGSSGGGATVTENPYTPIVNELLKFFFTPSNNNAAQQRALMMQALENERQLAIQRQETARAQKLDQIMQRLFSGEMSLKGVDSSGSDLRFKLSGEKRRLGMEVYQHPNDGKPRMGISGLSGINLNNEQPSTTKAQLSLKLGDDATQSLKPAAPTASEPVTTALAEPVAMDAEQTEVAALLAQLSPEQQQQLLVALQANGTKAGNDTPAPTVSTASDGSALEFKLAGAPPAEIASGAIEDIKAAGDQQFQQLQNVAVEGSNANQLVPTGGGSPGPQPPVGATERAEAEGPCVNPGTSDASTVDLRCRRSETVKLQSSPVPLAQTVTAAEPPSPVVRMKWPGPKNPGVPLRNPLWDMTPEQLGLQKPADDDLQLLFLDQLKDLSQRAQKLQEQSDLNLLFSDVVQPTPERREQLKQAALRRILESPEAPSREQRLFLVELFAPDLKVRYQSDFVFSQLADMRMDGKIENSRRYVGVSNLSALEKSLNDIAALRKRLGAGKTTAELQQMPDFVSGREKVIQEFDAAREANLRDGGFALSAGLELAFQDLRGVQ